MSILSPKKSKFRKEFKGRIKGMANNGVKLAFGEYGLKVLDQARVTQRQLEAARKVIKNSLHRAGKLWIMVFPSIPVTKKPAEIRMGKGKGSIDHYACRVKPGTIMFELDGVKEDMAREAFRKAGMKLPVRIRFVSRADDNFI